MVLMFLTHISSTTADITMMVPNGAQKNIVEADHPIPLHATPKLRSANPSKVGCRLHHAMILISILRQIDGFSENGSSHSNSRNSKTSDGEPFRGAMPLRVMQILLRSNL